jgi:hypothetical protein
VDVQAAVPIPKLARRQSVRLQPQPIVSNPFTSRQLRLPLGPGDAFKAAFQRVPSPRPVAPTAPAAAAPVARLTPRGK